MYSCTPRNNYTVAVTQMYAKYTFTEVQKKHGGTVEEVQLVWCTKNRYSVTEIQEFEKVKMFHGV